jgi:hypothetical protein
MTPTTHSPSPHHSLSPLPLPLHPIHLPLNIPFRPNPTPPRLSILPQPRRKTSRNTVVTVFTPLVAVRLCILRLGIVGLGFRSPRNLIIIVRPFRARDARRQRWFFAPVALAGVALAVRGVVVLRLRFLLSGGEGGAALAVAICGWAFGGLESCARAGGRRHGSSLATTFNAEAVCGGAGGGVEGR